ncbi:hypothetical protein V6N12_057563 [Hibiscus sabdariffa]|uniref:AAA+ ATPase domain-containing protein n=1 Tax=Hibiscus sabdariffa TaxID=183260 RepID=A0ABR2C5U6_9ROSI
MEITTGSASNVVTGVAGFLFQKIKGGFSYVRNYRKTVYEFEDKVETLKGKRDRVLLDVDAAEKNGDSIYPDVKNWLIKADDVVNTKYNEVKDLEGEAHNKCLVGFCPNFKARYQLCKKIEEEASAVDELLLSGGFDRVSYPGVPPPTADLPTKDFEDFKSRKQSFNNIMEAVKDTNVNIVGVHGMPGVGKTMLVKEVMRQVKEDKVFDTVVFAVVTHTPDIQKIQDQIADMLRLKFEEPSVSGRASRLRQRLKKEKKILVVLDDIWARLDLMEVGIPLEDEHQGCTILLTSRNLRVLSKGMDAKKSFAIGVLEDEEAWAFFKKMAGDGVESPDLSPIATDVAKKCGGLPIAIKALAMSLRDEPLFEWEDALCQLNRPSSSNFSGVPRDAYSAIEVSYDRLPSEEHKQTFLLCSLMGHDAYLDELLMCSIGLGLFRGVNTIEETRNRLLTVVSHLKACCLLIDSYSDHLFDMHDLICDVAVSIASKGNRAFVLKHGDVLNDWPDDETMEECDKISLRYASISKVPDQLKCSKLNLFCMGSRDPRVKIPSNFFKGMENLKVLILADMSFPSLPSSISLLANLRTLCLFCCVLGDISLVGELKNLEILCLVGSGIEMLPEEIGKLTKLKWLDLRDCSKLKRIPLGVFCKLTRLEELYMRNSFVEWGAEGHSSQQSNSSLAELEALSCLTALEIHIPNANIIPKDFFFEKLRRYIILMVEASDWDWVWDCNFVCEYSKTVRLNLQTRISFLNNGIKVLMRKAENLYIDEVKGVDMLSHDEFRDYFQQLKNLHIENGAMIRYILKDNVTVDRIEFLKLKSLTLKGLPNLISFYSGNNGSTSISPQTLETTLFNPKTLFPKLEKLKLSSISIERIWVPQAFCSTQNLTTLIIEGCTNLKHVLSDSMALHLRQLKCLEISECKCIREIISMNEASRNRVLLICFPRLKSLKFKGLGKLIGFCHEDYTVEFPALKIIEIENCPELKGFIHKSMSKDIPTDGVLFNKTVAFPSLRKIKISHLRNVKRIWYNQLHADSFSNLKELKVEYCNALLNIFPCFLPKVFQVFEILTITDCASLEEVFQLQGQGLDIEGTNVVSNQLREVNLIRLPKLKHVWNMDFSGNLSFENLRGVYIKECWSLKTLFPFSVAKKLQQLDRLTVNKCGVEKIVSKNVEGVEQEICFEFNRLSYLGLRNLPYLKCFYPGTHKSIWPALKQLRAYRCHKIKIFGHVEFQFPKPLFIVEQVIPQLEQVSFNSDDMWMVNDYHFEANLLRNIKYLHISCLFDEFILIGFLQRFYNLETLEVVGSCNFKELSPHKGDAGEDKDTITTLPKLKKLKLDYVNNTRLLWTQEDHIFASLESLEVWQCHSLINLGSYFSTLQNLTTLDVWKCKEMRELITSCKAQSLVCLVTLRIEECETMKEVVASEGDETTYEIVFEKLKCLELHCLPSLKSFCSGNHTFRFPSLEQVILSKCPKMNNFYLGVLSTPKLQKVQLTKTDFKGRWAGDLNATVEQLYKEQVGYRDLKHLKFSEFPELIDVWSRNPQEMLDFKSLEFLEVCDSNNLKCIFNLSMALSLERLQQLEIKRCNNFEQVIKEEDSKTVAEEAIRTYGSKTISIFPHLQSIVLESCSNMTSFYLGNTALECPSLKKIIVADCPNMTTFVSTFSRNEDNEAIIGNETDNVATFFSDEVAFPNLEKIKISHLKNVKMIWYNQLHAGSFSKLKELKVEYCDGLLNIFPFLLLQVFQRLEILTVNCCVSLQEVFQLQVHGLDIEKTKVVGCQLREVNLFRLPKLKHVWNKDLSGNLSFENLQKVDVWECWSLKTLFPFSIAKRLLQLESLIVDNCGVEEIVSKIDGGVEHEIRFEFNQLTFLKFWNLPNLIRFYPGMHKTVWPALKKLSTYWCGKFKIFGHVDSQLPKPLLIIEQTIPQLEEVSFSSDEIAMISDGQFAIDSFCHIKCLRVTDYLDESAVFPSHFLQRFSNLEMLELVSFDLEDFSPYEGDVGGEGRDVITMLPRIKELKLQDFDSITHLWKQGSPLDHICANLETLQVYECDSLSNLSCASSSFQNLTTLDVWECKEMVELITSSKAQSLERLVTLKIAECESMREVIASERDEATYHEVIFRELKCLELHCLKNLKSFCSGKYTLRFPSLDQVTVSQCPSLKKFCRGVVSTPKLRGVQHTGRGFSRRDWAGDLNATIEQLNTQETDLKAPLAGERNDTAEQLYKKQVGYRGLKILKFSDFPELIDIWRRNPQETLDFKNLKFLEVCDSNNLRCIFDLSMALNLRRLQQIEIKRCSNMEQVIKDEDSVTGVKDAIKTEIISIFPRLQSICVESCSHMTSFYLGSATLECPSLKEISLADCPNMAAFVSAFSRNGGEEAITGDEADNVATFFSNKVALPNLEKILVSHLRNVKRIWNNQLHAGSISKLKELKVECCDALLNIFPFLDPEVFQRLEILTIIDCASLEEVFQLQVHGSNIKETNVVVSQLREMSLICLPKLKHVWNKDPNGSISFGNLQKAFVWECWSLKTLFPFSIAKDLQLLESLQVDSCGVEEIVSKNFEGVEQAIWFEFNKLSFIGLWNLPNLICFYPGTHRLVWPALKNSSTYCCGKSEIFRDVESQPQTSHFSDKRGKSILPPVVFEKARSDLQQKFQVHNYTRRPILPLVPKVVQWCPPSVLPLKLNVDGAFRIDDRCGAVGFVVRNGVGFVLGGGAHFIQEAHSADFVEARAVIHALRFASLKGFKKVIIECDAPAVVSKLKNKLPDFSMLGSILEEAKQLMNSFEDVGVSYVHRLGNRVAHALASFGFDCNEPFTFGFNYPDFIRELTHFARLKVFELQTFSMNQRIFRVLSSKDFLISSEELYMSNSFVEWGAEGHSSQQSNSSLAELEALSCLTALEIHIPDANIIPKDFFEKLQRYSRTLRLSLQTSISCLNYGVKVLMKKAENLYIDEVKGVEMLSHDEFRDCFQQLKNLHIENGSMIQHVLEDDEAVHRIEFLQLKFLTLKGLPNLISFCSGNNGLTSISPQPQETTLFNQKLKLSSVSIERIWVPQAACSAQNLTTLIIEGCANLKQVLSDSMAEYLQQLKCLEISECRCIQEIISMQEAPRTRNRARPICLPRLNSLKLKGFVKLIRFCHEDYTVEFPALKITEIENV